MKRIFALKNIHRWATTTAILFTVCAPSVTIAQEAANPALGNALGEIEEHWSLLENNCYQCHNSEDWAGEIAFELMDPKSIPKDAEIWEEAVRRLRGGLMPPPGQDQPTPEARAELVSALEHVLDAGADPDPGYIGLHRLNGTEYENAVYDLLGLTIDASQLLPTDAVSGGFDNIAGAFVSDPVELH